MEEWAGESDPRGGPEVWVYLHNRRYAVSSEGRIWSNARRKGEILRPTFLQSGYQSVGIYKTRGSKAATILVHRLVVEAFDGLPPSGLHTDVRHLDGKKRNNGLINLRYGTRSENMMDVIKHRQEKTDPTPAETEKNNWYQGYTADDYIVRIGLELHEEGVVTVAHLVRLWRCSRDVAANIVHGETRKHIERPEEPRKRKRRSPRRKAAITDLIREGHNAESINSILDESLSSQDVYYYKTKLKKA
jgi:hypothetical protein